MDGEDLKTNEEGKQYKWEEDGIYYGGDYPEKEEETVSDTDEEAM